MVMIDKLTQQEQHQNVKTTPLTSTDESSHEEDCESLDEKRSRLYESTPTLGSNQAQEATSSNLIHKIKYKKYLLNGDPVTPPEDVKSPVSGDEQTKASFLSDFAKFQGLNLMDQAALVDYMMMRSRSSSAESSNSLKNLLPITYQSQQSMKEPDTAVNNRLNATRTTNASSVCTPCKVCGDEASGFHYGVDSCEGCKGFFRRCITQGMNHQCTNGQQCEITPFSRNSCQFCRLKKCFTVGMSREASRLGRRPKRPREQQAINGSSDQPLALIAPTSTPVKQQQQIKEEDINIGHLASFKLDSSDILKKPMLNQTNASLLDEDTDSETSISIKNEHDFVPNFDLVLKTIEISDRYLSYERQNELEYMRCTIIEAYCQLWPTTHAKIAKKLKYNAPKMVSNLSSDEKSIESLVPLIMDVVKCSKYIPGFSELHQQDQLQLLKQGSFEVIGINSLALVDVERKLMYTNDLECVLDRLTLSKMPLGFYYVDIFDLSLQFAHLKLNDADVALLNAILILNSNRDDLTCKERVADLRATLLHCLFRHLKHTRSLSDEPEIFLKILKIIPHVEAINLKHGDALNMLQMKKVPTLKARTNSESSGSSDNGQKE